jgi:hypothetical protein
MFKVLYTKLLIFFWSLLIIFSTIYFITAFVGNPVYKFNSISSYSANSSYLQYIALVALGAFGSGVLFLSAFYYNPYLYMRKTCATLYSFLRFVLVILASVGLISLSLFSSVVNSVYDKDPLYNVTKAGYWKANVTTDDIAWLSNSSTSPVHSVFALIFFISLNLLIMLEIILYFFQLCTIDKFDKEMNMKKCEEKKNGEKELNEIKDHEEHVQTPNNELNETKNNEGIEEPKMTNKEKTLFQTKTIIEKVIFSVFLIFKIISFVLSFIFLFTFFGVTIFITVKHDPAFYFQNFDNLNQNTKNWMIPLNLLAFISELFMIVSLFANIFLTDFLNYLQKEKTAWSYNKFEEKKSFYCF